MKILNIMQGTNLGGMEKASLRLMIGLKERGHSCEVISLNPVGGLGPLLEMQKIPVKGLPYLGKGGWRSIFLLSRILRTVKADALIMTGHHLLSMLALRDLCRGRRLLAIHFHHTGVKPSWQWRIIYHVACSRFQAVTYPSDFVRTEAEFLYPKVKLISHTLRNPLSIQPLPSDEEKRQARKMIGVPAGAFVVGNAGWLIPRKRFDVFLKVCNQVAKEAPESLFLIAGDGEERQSLEKMAYNLGLSGQVKWLGWCQELKFFYQSLDVMLFNSDWDAMGLTPLEALTYGIPLVASVLNGGLNEIVNRENYGFLIPRHDIEALAAKILFFWLNPNEARRMALTGRDRVAALSSPQELSAEVERLLL